MVPHTFSRVVRDGVTTSVVELNGVHHVFASALSQTGSTFREQTQSVLESVLNVLGQFDAAESLLHLTCFVAEPNQVAACRQVVRSALGNNVPATTYVAQPPCDGRLVAVEVIALGKGREKVQIERISDQLLLARQNGHTWIYADQAVPLTSASGVYEKTICSYQHLRRLLPRGGARLDQVVRTWLYLGGIVDDDGEVQRYKELNRARSDVYDGIPFLQDRLPAGHDGQIFPASTGIGTRGRSLCLSALALVSDNDDVVAVPLENPRQTAAFAYSTRYSPQSPKFSRGMAVVQGEDSTLFISGTASITHSETRHIDNVVAQTHETLDNITALISEENLAHHGLHGRGTTLDGLAVARVYVKRPEDYEAVREVCRQRLPGVPLNFVNADVCRTNLLVEIEGIAFSHTTIRAEDPVPIRARRCADCSGECHQVCPQGCPEREICPYAVLD